MKANRKNINLFEDKDILPYKVVFNITKEEDLLIWWEYHLENFVPKHPSSVSFLHNLYRSFYHLLEERKVHFDITFEEAINNVYWTLLADTDISSFQKSCPMNISQESKTASQQICFKLSTLQIDIEHKPQDINAVYIQETSSTLIIYDFLDEEDKSHMLEINEELNEELIYLEGKGFSLKSIEKIQKLLAKYSFILSSYVEIHQIKSSIDELSYFMNEHQSTLIYLDNSYVSLFEGLIVNLQKWYEALFLKGASSIESYQKSIQADVEIIKMMTVENENHGEIEFF